MTNEQSIEGSMQWVVNRNSLAYSVGSTMFCPGMTCQKCLDVRNAVEVTISRDGRILRCFCCCGDCWDKARAGVEKAVAALAGGRLEVIDGRVLYARSEQPPAATPQRNPVRKGEVVIGGEYLTRVGGRMVTVRILREKTRYVGRNSAEHKSWVGLNLRTKREIVIKSAARLRGLVKA